MLSDLVPPQTRWASLDWRSVRTGAAEWSVVVDGQVVAGRIRPYLATHAVLFQVSELGFDRVIVDSLDEGYDLLLQREFSARQVARLEEALAARREILEGTTP